MTSGTQMKKVLDGLTKELSYELPDIQHTIESKIKLDKEDWEPISTSATYPKWKHTLQTALADLKRRGIATHVEGTPAKKAKNNIKIEPKYTIIKSIPFR